MIALIDKENGYIIPFNNKDELENYVIEEIEDTETKFDMRGNWEERLDDIGFGIQEEVKIGEPVYY